MSSTDEREKMLKETETALKRIQDFDAASLARSEELGRELNFQGAVVPARRIVELFRQVAIEVLPELSTAMLRSVRDEANSEFNRFSGMLSFSAANSNPKGERDSYITGLISNYDRVFDQLWPAIAYSVRRSSDFAKLEREARSRIQSIVDQTADLRKSLESDKAEAQSALEAIRKVAAEQGVSQQAIHFKQEADAHALQARKWLGVTSAWGAFILSYVVGGLFLHKWEWLAPSSTYDIAQLIVSKILIFSTLIFFFVLSVRNYMSHRHNVIVNRHRQNSLVTYRALVEAAGDLANRDIVLTKAADSIFGSEVTGFVKSDGSDGSSLSMVNVTPALVKSVAGSSPS